MAFPHDGYPFPMEHLATHNMYFQHGSMPGVVHPQTPDMVYHQYALPHEYADFMHPGMLMDEYEDPTEMSTRPRLTKEQVEVLENQFQAHPKPNSMVKKQLAMQTKLTLPRVANWFQNRRAKAKQQKKQEEYESQQTGDSRSSANDDDSSHGYNERTVADVSHHTTSPPECATAVCDELGSSTPRSLSPMKSSDAAKEASWLSLQRALNAAKAGQRQRAVEQQVKASMSMLPPDMSRPAMGSSQPTSHSGVNTPADWSQKPDGPNWNTTSPTPDYAFDFGFDADSLSQRPVQSLDSATQALDQYTSGSDWGSSYMADTPSAHTSDYCAVASPPLPLPAYPGSRRGSGAEELTANFGTFALAGTPPVAAGPMMQTPALRSTEGEIDIASRRKRPRPAALTSASLRSRSYGALSSTSPAYRSGPPSGGQLRHVKSTGHGLNSYYAGVRKSSIPQKSPLNISTFAEAESFRELMAQHASAKTPQPLTTDLGIAQSLALDHEQMNFADVAATTHQPTPSEFVAPYKHVQSPPVTPYQQEFMLQAGLGMQAAQYANFAEYTPPYSAGPLTNSTCSWSDAPVLSPDLPNFPAGTFMSSLNYNARDHGFQQFVLPSDPISEHGLNSLSDDRKTEFFITEFPGQREEHASVAQHIMQQKPKSYVFANSAPCDYDS